MADLFLIHSVGRFRQLSWSLLLVCFVSMFCYAFSSWLDYRVVAFILLVTVSLIAVSFDILPVLIAATLSAWIWNFFFIPPRFTFHVGSTDDQILFIMYFMIATVNAVLTFKIRQVEKAARQKKKELTPLTCIIYF